MSSPSLVVGRHGRSLANIAARRTVAIPKTSTATGATGRRLLSSKPDTKPPPTTQNVALAAVLFGFCGAVFTYSLNQVGRSQEDSDPLAQLKAEAQEAREEKSKHRKLTPEEVAALESGMTGGDGERPGDIEVAVAAPADIAQIEEEANLKVFRQNQGEEEPKKKKAW
eukprot:CAMPEP_0116998342 /NCGR_PEP_ID=MMETSP0472-20121206/1444_1 /TAXON_ID=693140 ORGANISM="Tiarina fusus, Strain LIS" /NCGR_SAMPLE_ID=MMETSP0472 /ASSEMBLY_ACC=CAM_ASM_000603 /LENGTH=167 /DNA_ID=CAMNT_0004697459 /DNA_START=157 /DNA_END=657 /DNA_ORIENTATION=-